MESHKLAENITWSTNIVKDDEYLYLITEHVNRDQQIDVIVSDGDTRKPIDVLVLANSSTLMNSDATLKNMVHKYIPRIVEVHVETTYRRIATYILHFVQRNLACLEKDLPALRFIITLPSINDNDNEENVDSDNICSLKSHNVPKKVATISIDSPRKYDLENYSHVLFVDIKEGEHSIETTFNTIVSAKKLPGKRKGVNGSNTKHVIAWVEPFGAELNILHMGVERLCIIGSACEIADSLFTQISELQMILDCEEDMDEYFIYGDDAQLTCKRETPLSLLDIHIQHDLNQYYNATPDHVMGEASVLRRLIGRLIASTPIDTLRIIGFPLVCTDNQQQLACLENDNMEWIDECNIGSLECGITGMRDVATFVYLMRVPNLKSVVLICEYANAFTAHISSVYLGSSRGTCDVKGSDDEDNEQTAEELFITDLMKSGIETIKIITPVDREKYERRFEKINGDTRSYNCNEFDSILEKMAGCDGYSRTNNSNLLVSALESNVHRFDERAYMACKHCLEYKGTYAYVAMIPNDCGLLPVFAFTRDSETKKVKAKKSGGRPNAKKTAPRKKVAKRKN